MVAPTLTSLEPNTAAISDPDFTIRCIGDGFDDTSRIIWMGAEEPTTLVSPTEVTTGVVPSVVTAPTTIDVLVRNVVDTVPTDSETLVFTWTEAVAPPQPTPGEPTDDYAGNPQLPPQGGLAENAWTMFIVAATNAVVPHARDGVDFAVARPDKYSAPANVHWDDALLGPRPDQAIEDEARRLAAEWPETVNPLA